MLWDLGKITPKFSFTQDRCSLHRSFESVNDEGFQTTETTSGHVCRVFELEGYDYTGLDEKEIINKFNGRRKFIESVGVGIVPTVYTLRFQLSKSLDIDDHGSFVSNEIAHDWSKGFESTFRNRHFLMLRTESAGVLDRFVDSQKGGGESLGARLARLDELGSNVEKELSDYSPHLLKGDSLASFWSTLLNGETSHIKMPKDGIYDDLLSSCGLYWPSDRQNVQIYEGNQDRFSTWITLKIFDDAGESAGVRPTVFNDLFGLDHEYLLVQSFDIISKEDSLKQIKKLKARFESFEDDSLDLKIDELANLLDEIQKDSIKLTNFRFALQVFADTEAELITAVSSVNKVIKNHGFNSLRERGISEALFWSMFPSYEKKLQPRNRVMTTSNVACHVNFSSIGEGLNSCSWGDMPVMPLFTENGSEYSFCFHSNSQPKSLGHTLLMGGSGQGKTTFMMMLATHCRKYPNMKQIFLDQLRGMEVAIKLQGGEYVSFDSQPKLNPFQQVDSNSNRIFLTNWLQMLSGSTDNRALETIHKVINQSYQLPQGDRYLDSLVSTFGLQTDDSIRDNMARWFSGGAFEGFFTSKTDSLDFKSSMVGFDMTAINKSPEILAPVAAYIYHRIEEMVQENPSPFIVWTDEYKTHITNPILAKETVKAKEQYRKLDGVSVDAVQDISHVVGTKREPNKMGIDSINQYENFIFFPTTSADPDLLSEHCNISNDEFDWITDTSNTRKILLKKKSGSSTILDVDLSRLGMLLKSYSSDADRVMELRKLMKTNKNNWAKEFLGL